MRKLITFRTLKNNCKYVNDLSELGRASLKYIKVGDDCNKKNCRIWKRLEILKEKTNDV